MREVDEKYHDLARNALFMGLYDCKIQDDASLKIENSEILKAFDYSGNILRSNSGDDHYRMMAETVFETCIRLTRCLFFPMEARTLVLHGIQYSISAEQQIDVLRRNLKKLEQYKS
ncbi:MAG: hypothetical protein P8X74_22935 [Reinekea sp.]